MRDTFQIAPIQNCNPIRVLNIVHNYFDNLYFSKRFLKTET